MKTFKYIVLLYLALLAVLACNNEVLDQINPNQQSDTTYYQNDQELTNASNAIYATVQSVLLAGREYWFVHDLRSDEMTRGTGGGLEVPRGELLDGTHGPTNSVMNRVWRGLYQAIHRSNALLERGVDAPDSDIKTIRLGEARFLRAWAYFELVSLWGEVPLYTEYAKVMDETQPKSALEALYTQIHTDLEEALGALPYIRDISDEDLGRVSKEAAWTLMARVHMFNGNYTDAREALQNVIDSPSNLRLIDDYYTNFTEEGEFNDESIWEIGYSLIGEFNWDEGGGGNDQGGVLNEGSVRHQEYSAVGWRNLMPSLRLLNEHERPSQGDAKEDPRLRYNYYFVGDPINNGTETLLDEDVPGLSTTFDGVTTKISWRKYSILYKESPEGFRVTGNNHRMMRFAEVKLMMAECENELNNPAEALEHLNDIRRRPTVDMPEYPTANYPAGTKEEIFDAIVHEKMVEMAGEQVRNRDILRWRAQGKLSTDPIGYYEPKHQRLPLPQAEIDNNDKITQEDQNPGY